MYARRDCHPSKKLTLERLRRTLFPLSEPSHRLTSSRWHPTVFLLAASSGESARGFVSAFFFPCHSSLYCAHCVGGQWRRREQNAATRRFQYSEMKTVHPNKTRKKNNAKLRKSETRNGNSTSATIQVLNTQCLRKLKRGSFPLQTKKCTSY